MQLGWSCKSLANEECGASFYILVLIWQQELLLINHQHQETSKSCKLKKMAEMKYVFGVMLVIVLVAQNHLMVSSQVESTCSASLSTLNACAPFVVPGGSGSNPSSDCCGALQAVNKDCLCSTLRIASRIPVQCNLPPLNCAN